MRHGVVDVQHVEPTIARDPVVRLDPNNGQMRVISLPSKNTGIRKMAVDGAGRLWYMGSHSGRLGRIE